MRTLLTLALVLSLPALAGPVKPSRPMKKGGPDRALITENGKPPPEAGVKGPEKKGDAPGLIIENGKSAEPAKAVPRAAPPVAR